MYLPSPSSFFLKLILCKLTIELFETTNIHAPFWQAYGRPDKIIQVKRFQTNVTEKDKEDCSEKAMFSLAVPSWFVTPCLP